MALASETVTYLFNVDIQRIIIGRSQGARLPIEMLFQIFRLNFSREMSKMHYFSNNFSKIASAGSFPSSAPLNLQYW